VFLCGSSYVRKRNEKHGLEIEVSRSKKRLLQEKKRSKQEERKRKRGDGNRRYGIGGDQRLFKRS